MFSDTTYQGAKKNSSDQSEELSIFFVDIIKLVSDLSVPIFHRDGVGTLLSACNLARYTASAGCQGFFGPFPSAFLDKRCCKNCGKDIPPFAIFPNLCEFFIHPACRCDMAA